MVPQRARNGSKPPADRPATLPPLAQSLARRVLFAKAVLLRRACDCPPQESLVRRAAQLAAFVGVWAKVGVEGVRIVPDGVPSLPVGRYRSRTRPPWFSPPA